MFVINNYEIYISFAEIEHIKSQEKVTNLVNLLNKEENKFRGHSFFIIDAEAIAGMKHLQACIHFAIKAFKQNLNTAKSLKAEILLYISGSRQIRKAIEYAGLSISSNDILLIQLIELIDKQNKIGNNLIFNFKEFLKNNLIVVKNFSSNIFDFKPKFTGKLMSNLDIKENLISLFVNPNDPQYSRENVLEKLAIEKSAQLNLIK